MRGSGFDVILNRMKWIGYVEILPSLLYNGYRVFAGGKVRPGRAADHSSPSSAEVLEE